MATKGRGKAAAPERLRVVIVGGGCAGLAAAWQLSRMPAYEVHVYERGERLGGKGASVRDDSGRIHEHGLHVWLGFYENAFRMMRECYAEVLDRGWGPDHGDPARRLAHASFEEAFFPEPHVGVAVDDYAGGWDVWSGHLPPMKGLPGDSIDADTNPFTLANYLLRCLELIKALMLSMVEPVKGRAPGEPLAEERAPLDEEMELDFTFDPVRSPRALLERMARMLRVGVLTTAAGILQGVTIAEDWVHTLNFAPQVSGTVLEFLEALAAQTRKQLRDFVAIDPRLRRKTEVIDIVMTIAVGLYRDKVLFDRDGLDVMNGIDYRKWLAKHGATKSAVASPFLTGIYDLVFAYRDGDPKRPALAAGVALRGALRMFFTYRGAMFWRMRSGMGDTVFAPLYKVLSAGRSANEAKEGLPAREKVTFHFSHSLAGIDFDLDPAREHRVTALHFDVPKADSGKGVLDHFGCWPQPREGDAPETKKIVLEADKDFDVVVFALGVDDFVRACGDSPSGPARSEFFKALPDWDRMRKRVRTAPTKVAQVWFEAEPQELGWMRAPGLITALGPPFDTWANMTHTIVSERAWRRANGVEAEYEGAVAYLCGTLPDRIVQNLEAKHAQKADKIAREKAIKQDLKERIHAELEQVLPDLARSKIQDELKKRIVAALDSGTKQYGLEDGATLWYGTRQLLTDEIAGWLAKLLQPGADETALALRDMVDSSLQAIESQYAQTPPEELARRIAADLTAFLGGDVRRKSVLSELFAAPSVRYTDCQANFAGSERYTLSPPGSIRYRISPLDRSVVNMTIAGDWTACGLDAGCVESAVMSGMLAVHAITGSEPRLDDIVGFHHP